jgi:hypothetical protein
MKRSESYQLLVPKDTAKNISVGSTSAGSLHFRLPVRHHSKPARKPLVNIVDAIAVLLSVLCLAAAVIVISPSLHYAAQLQYTRQIIAVGFLLGIMNQCLQRTAPYLFIIIETRLGHATLQSYDGLLRWSPLADHLRFVWRFLLVILLLLPLVLGVLYKRFTGGIGQINLPISGGIYGPTAPSGLEAVAGLSIMANSTIPFMAASNDAIPFNALTEPQAFGFNILLLSNTSAAALDGPVSHHVTTLQNKTTSDSVLLLTANVRGTVAQYNATAESHRNDTAFWDKYLNLTTSLSTNQLWNGYDFGFFNINTPSSDDPAQWDPSWSFLGVFPAPDENYTQNIEAFKQTALGFDVSRHPCHGTWRLTRSSIDLISGHCSATPLGAAMQYYDNSQLGLQTSYTPMLAEYLGPFATKRAHSQWLLPTFAVVTASMYSSAMAQFGGEVAIQPAGWLDQLISDNDPSFNGTYIERYFLNNTLVLEVPTLEPLGTLYFVLVIQPILTLAAFVAVTILYETPISRGFGLVSILAGVDRNSLNVLDGATFSGEIGNPVGLRINIKREEVENNSRSQRVEYVVGQSGFNGWIKRRSRFR